MPEQEIRTVVVAGRAIDPQGRPVSGVELRADLRRDGADEWRPGKPVRSGDGGAYVIRFTAEDMDASPTELPNYALLVRATRDGRPIGDSDIVRLASQLRIDVTIDARADEPDQPVEPPPPDLPPAEPHEPGDEDDGVTFRVHGVVRDQYGDLFDGVVEAHDRDLRSEQILGRDRTEDGGYDIRYRRGQFRKAEKGLADLVMKVLDLEGKPLYESPVRYNADADLEWDLVLSGATYRGPSEWEVLTTAFTPVLDDVAPSDLREDAEFQDISFLAGETGYDRLTIGRWVAAIRLGDKAAQEKTPLPAEGFYAFIRQGQPSILYETLVEDVGEPDRVVLLGDKLLRSLAELTEDRQRELLEHAISENLVPARLERQIDEIIEILRGIRLSYAAQGTFGGGKGTIGELLALTPAAGEHRAAFMQALTSHSGSFSTFWKAVVEDGVLPSEVADQVKLTFELGALTRNHVPLVAELSRELADGTLTSKRDLARLDEAGWVAIFQRPGPDGAPIGVPANIDGEDEPARLAQFATIVQTQLERAYPTAAFSARLERSQEGPIKSKTGVVRFLETNPEFQLDRFRIDHYLAERPEALAGIEGRDQVVRDLKTVQRVFKLKSTYAAVDALLQRGIDSAQQIYFMGQGQFVAAMAESQVNRIEARKLYRRAENTYADVLHLFTDLNQAVNGIIPAAVPTMAFDDETQAKIAALPNLQTLFGSLDYCECSHCRSVYGPAAYFVDVLRFLGERGTQGVGINAGKSVRDVLLGRRPDLGEIELSCENTNTPLPYIDLVNEILEDVVAPPDPVILAPTIEADLVEGPIAATVLADLQAKSVAIDPDAYVYAPDSRANWVIRDDEHAYRVSKRSGSLELLPTHQSFLSAAELRANPEYTNEAAYERLAGEVFPPSLPFDLARTQARRYLEHLGVPQPRLLELFQQRLADDVTLAPTNLQIDCAWLGIGEVDRQILTGSFAGPDPWDYWGLAETGNDIPHPDTPADPTTNLTGTWIEVLSHVPVMLNRAGLEYRELLQVLDMRAVDPDRSITILDTADPNAANCDPSTFVIDNLTSGALGRLNRFVRLWRTVGSSMWELDLVLPDVDPSPTIVDKPITDDALQQVSRLNRLRDSLRLDWAELDAIYHGFDEFVYDDHDAEGAPAIQSVYQRLFRNRLVDAVAAFPASPSLIAGTVGASVPGILAALRIREADLGLILEDIGVTPSDTLGAPSLVAMYRQAVLARALGLSVDGLLRLERLWGQDPFADPGATLSFVELATFVKDSGFSVLELDYLLAHRFTPSSGIGLEDKTIAALLQALRSGFQAIDDDIRKKSEETAEAYVRSKLGRLPALAKDADQGIALSIIDDSWSGTPADRDALIDTFFSGVLDTTIAKATLAALPGGLDSAARQDAVDARFAFVQPELQRFLLRTAREAFVRQKCAETFGLDVPSAAALLGGLTVPASSNSLLDAINDDHLLDRNPDGSYQRPLDETNFGFAFKAMRLLHKVALIVARLDLRASDIQWWIVGTRATDLGWMHPGALPVDTTTPLDIDQWVAIRTFFGWRAGLPKADISALDFAERVLDPAVPSTDNLADLASLLAWDAVDIDALATAFHWTDGGAFDAIKARLRIAANLDRLSEVRSALRRLGVNAARALEWATAEPDAADADSLKQTVKAKYDLAQWLEVIEPIQDEFREQKRTALVAWLITHPDQAQGQTWSNSNDLFSYFLIDVEMNACMLTSRLKQASASAQLFVQRCLLNLEVDIIAKTDLDPKWKQWQWMKRYRVWEANRKVFLYPENWIEPELRDEKSPFFKELETELQQNDVTNDTVEQAYLNYLEKLEKVANLEIRATFDQTISADESVMHVFGRTRSSVGPDHFYRTRINRGRWTAWEKIDPEIASDHLVAGIHNRRLFLLWPQFLDKADDPPASMMSPDIATSTPIPQPERFWEIHLFWSERKKGKWTPKTLSNSFIRRYQRGTSGNNPDFVEFRTRLAPYIQVRLYTSPAPGTDAPTSQGQFDKLGRQVSAVGSPVIEHLVAPPESEFSYNLIEHTSPSQYFYFGSVEETGKGHAVGAHENAPSIRLLKNVTPKQTYSVIDSRAAAFPAAGTFFVWDPSHTYHVDYSWRTDYSYYSKAWHSRLVSSFQFFIHYHPFVELFIKELNIWGIKGLLNRRIQVDPATIPGSPTPFDFSAYQPDGTNVVPELPSEVVDFSYKGAYSPYNWELFFHVPMLIANRLAANQRFEEALGWYHYVFDPTSTDNVTLDPDTPQQRYWITKPFYETTKADYYSQKIENILLAIAKGDAEAREQVREWRDNPFKPHLIARLRTVAYQKNVLIKYIGVLIAWGDQLFAQDTIETINEATQLYILAASVLGPRPRSIPRNVENPIRTFYQLRQLGIDDFGNALKEIENLVPPASTEGGSSDEDPELPHLDVLYFCIPNNAQLLTLWDTVADRLFKIRNCLNIEGVFRQLPLFEPPIDPALLVKATAAGLDIGAVLADISAPLPNYRFTFMVRRALEVCDEVRMLGSALLAALEKRDAEDLGLLRSTHEQVMLAQVRMVRTIQVDEAMRIKEGWDESRKVVERRRVYYEGLVKGGLNTWENLSLGLTGGAIVAETVATVLNAIGSGTALIPEVNAGASGFGGSPHVTLTLGGKSVTSGVTRAAEVSRGVASVLQIGAAMSATIGNHNRRADEWRFLQQLAERELPEIDKQILAADLRHDIAAQELVNQDRQIEQASEVDEYLHSKFTNDELYDWMIDQISTVYFQGYQLAYDLAKKAERCFRYELGLTTSSYVQFGYWDSLRKGLLSGERLQYDLRRLEAAFYEQNRREYELTKHISLAQLDPIALMKLRTTGECFLDIPETWFDADYPGHYFRRIKSLALSIPCTVGPYTTIGCTLTLVSNHLRRDATLLAGKYERDLTIDDPRFRDEIAAVQSVATSGSQNDAGLFELNFRDERYLPFEGAGAICSVRMRLNAAVPQFDLDTISDVIIHMSYTAREGGDLLGSKAREEFEQKLNDMVLAEGRTGLMRVFDLRREYPDKWYQFLHPANPADDQALVLNDLVDRLPYFTRSFPTKKVRQVEAIARMTDGSTYKLLLSPLGETPADELALDPDATYGGLHRALKDLTGSEIDFGSWTLKLRLDGVADFKSLPDDAIEDLFLAITYTVA